MKQPGTIVIVFLLLLAATAAKLVDRADLREVRLRTGMLEVAVSLACESGK